MPIYIQILFFEHLGGRKEERNLRIGVAGIIFEPHPPNFENLYNF